MNKGILYGIGAYAIWGLFPLYWKAMASVPSLQIVAHRLVWCLVFVAVLVWIMRGWTDLRKAITRRLVLLYTVAAALLTVNWLVYIWGVNAGFVVETSLGYFINPLVNVALGVLFFKERLSLSKWLPIGLAAVGVLYLTISYGQLPWISLALAFSFGLYGLMKKALPLNALQGLTLETAVLFVPSLAFLLFVEAQGTGSLFHETPLVNLLLILAGPVTALPLLLFSGAARSIPLSTLGLLQYIAPTLQFMLGVFVYHEPFTQERLIGFAIIWLALIILTVGGLVERRRAIIAVVGFK